MLFVQLIIWRKIRGLCYKKYVGVPISYADVANPFLKAEKAAQGAGGGFSLFGGRTEKYENAADLYTQAANAFRMQKQGTCAPAIGFALPPRPSVPFYISNLPPLWFSY